MTLARLNIPNPTELRGGWAALSVLYAIHGYNDVVTATEDEWFYSDMGGNWACLRFTGDGKAVLLGHDHEYSQTALTEANTATSPLLQNAPAWWIEHIKPFPYGDTIGFVYGWEENKWQRANYAEEDGFQYVGLLHAIRLTGSHSISEKAEYLIGSTDEHDLAALVAADANIDENHVSKITTKNIPEGVRAGKNFLKAPLASNSASQQQFVNIQSFNDAVTSSDFYLIEDCRDEITQDRVPDMVAYYNTLDNWDYKTGCIEILRDQSGSDIEKIMLDYLRVPTDIHDDRTQSTLASALCTIEKSGSFETYYYNREELQEAVSRMLDKHGLGKADESD